MPRTAQNRQKRSLFAPKLTAQRRWGKVVAVVSRAACKSSHFLTIQEELIFTVLRVQVIYCSLDLRASADYQVDELLEAQQMRQVGH